MALTPIHHRFRRLGNPDIMGDLLRAVDRQHQLLVAVQTQLAPSLAQHCRFADLEEGRLTLVTDSPVWAARLRFLAPELLAALRGSWGEILDCRVRVQPTSGPPYPPTSSRAGVPLSPATRQLLLDAAEVQAGTDLGLALRRLALAGTKAGM
ncbi:MAG: DUF721 domain-containing protein [Gammaproteobacteria bacterium]|nr:MAG: DUF721 domain-containing protein [Gammaproteobacteria bacterium]